MTKGPRFTLKLPFFAWHKQAGRGDAAYIALKNQKIALSNSNRA